MNKTYILLISFLLLSAEGFSQVLYLRDRASRTPLEAAAIFSETANKFTTTDSRGRADISGFRNVTDIVVRLLGYKTEIYNWEELSEKQFRIYLETAEISLDEIVVSATRWQQKKRDIPSKITIIQKKDVLLENPQTAADLLGMSGEIFIQKSQMGGGSPMIRGFSTNRVLITVDGVRMNNAIFRSGNIQNVIALDPFTVETTEILFGPGAVMYGSDALGGVMNFYSIQPKLKAAGKPSYSLNTAARFSTANMEKTGHVDFQTGLEKWAFVTSISFSDFGDLRAGKRGPEEFLRPDYVTRIEDVDTMVVNPNPGVQTPSGYQQMNLMQKIRFVPSEKLDVQYGFHYSLSSDVPRYDRLIERNNQGNLRDGEWYYGPQKWMMNTFNLTYFSENKLFNNLKGTIAHQYFEESRHNRDFRSNNLNHRTETVDAISLNLDLDKILNEQKSLLYGAEMILNKVGSLAERENIQTLAITPLSTRYPDGSTWYSAAAYMNYLNRATEKTTFQTGIRYNYTGLRAEFDQTFYPFPFESAKLDKGALTGSAGLAYKPTNDWQLNANLSTGFRAPNIDDIGKVFDSEPGNVIVPNPGLKPEYAWNVDLGVTRIIESKAKIDISAFYTLLDDALVRRPFAFNGLDSIEYDGQPSRVLAIQNAAAAQVYGLQAAVEIKINRWATIISRLTWQNGEEELDDGSTAPLRHAVPLFGITRLTWSGNQLKAELYACYQGRVNFEDMPDSEIAKPHLYAMDDGGNPYSPGWFTLNLKASYQVSDFVLLTAGLENITNTLYRPYSSGISAPGTNLVLAIRASF